MFVVLVGEPAAYDVPVGEGSICEGLGDDDVLWSVVVTAEFDIGLIEVTSFDEVGAESIDPVFIDHEISNRHGIDFRTGGFLTD